MRKLPISLSIIPSILLSLVFAYAGTPGSFRGKVVESAQSAIDPNWIYVEGRNKMVRRVEISHARIEYSEDVPAANRKLKPRLALITGTEVRITAEQGSDGEWRASRVEILNSGEEGKSAAGSPPTGKS